MPQNTARVPGSPLRSVGLFPRIANIANVFLADAKRRFRDINPECQPSPEVPPTPLAPDRGHLRHKTRRRRPCRSLDPEFLIISRKFGQRGLPIGISLSFEFHKRLETDAPMGTHPAVVDLSFIEQLDQRYPLAISSRMRTSIRTAVAGTRTVSSGA
jgi:hypothetical protein